MREDLAAFDEDDPVVMPDSVLSQLRSSWMSLVAKVLGIDDDGKVLHAKIPALKGCELMCEVLGIEPSDALYTLFSAHHTEEALNTPEAFLTELRKAVEAGKCHLARTVRQFRSGDGGIGYNTDAGVVLSQFASTKAVVSNDDVRIFALDHLSDEFQKRGMLAPYSGGCNRKHWVIKQEVWDSYMGCPLIKLPSLKKTTTLDEAGFKFVKVG